MNFASKAQQVFIRLSNLLKIEAADYFYSLKEQNKLQTKIKTNEEHFLFFVLFHIYSMNVGVFEIKLV